MVPMSTAMRISGVSPMRVARATATASAPTKPATMGSRHTRASGVHLEEELARGQLARVAHHRRIGRQPHVGRIDAEQDVVHARVADHDHLVDPLGEHAGVRAELLHVLVQEPDDPRLELAQVPGIELREGDARHEVGAEHGLRVQARDGGELLARLELHEGGHHARGADVHRDPEPERRVSPASTAMSAGPTW